MNLEALLSMLGGIGLFLYGMKLMGQSLERFAGAKMEKTLEKLTSNKAKGVLLGAGVTAVIQSSSATIIMVIGFLNAGIMRLMQAVPVIMGANIGTTVTAQILRLGDINNDNMLLQMLKPASFAPLCVVIGAFVILLAKKAKSRDKAGIAVGLGILFIGMSMMESSFKPLADSPEFMNVFLVLTNPVLGILAGMAVTILLQSSSASVGVLQAMSTTGGITFAMAAPIVIGQNIGKCVTVLLASIGTNKNSKRAVCIDVCMAFFGAAIFLAIIYLYQNLVGFSFWDKPVNRGKIADFHTLFNLGTCVFMLPFVNALIKISERIVKDKGVNKIEEELILLDPIFVKSPGVALGQCQKVMSTVASTAMENYKLSTDCYRTGYSDENMEKLRENENFLDKSESALGDYLIKITEQQLDPRDNRLCTEFMHAIGDFERIGDHCKNLIDVAEYNSENDVHFSENALFEIRCISDAVEEIMTLVCDAYTDNTTNFINKVVTLEDTIDELVDILKTHRIQRLMGGHMSADAGISFVEILGNMERIGDHCVNVAIQVHQRLNNENLDPHENLARFTNSEEYKSLMQHYCNKYIDPVMNRPNVK
ncbi:MAG: Na/Pi cotransporter family protein [Clostridia bacterium]|nr:Na/Pi cotransporter family protein [Clostridia bacterium]MDO5302535.1 Na/Pi cotransporter family protein [Clostridia bacterium]